MEARRRENLDFIKNNLIWRSNIMSSSNLSEESFNEQKTIVNSMLSSYYDEMDPRRKLERKESSKKNKTKFDSLQSILKKGGFKVVK